MSRQLFRDNIGFRNLLEIALRQGQTLAPIMSVSGYKKCQSPFQTDFVNIHKGFVKKIQVFHPCRKCLNCLRLRQYIWRRKARVELQRHAKAWFVTLTFKPDERLKHLYAAQTLVNKGSSGAPEPELTAELIKTTGKEVQNFLKRVRHHAKEEIRILFVSELHKDGFPHWHGLIFGEEITKAKIEQSWYSGFTAVKLVRDEGSLDYVTKYLSKDAQSRIRASLHFGRPFDKNRTVRTTA